MFLISIFRLITSPIFNICHMVMHYYERDIADSIYNSTKPVVYNENNYNCCCKCCPETNEENTTLLGSVLDAWSIYSFVIKLLSI